MKQRCENTKLESYKHYGGRGITVCDRWKVSFSDFLNDMGLCPSGMLLDRINNDKGYFPGNCRWTTPTVSCNNTRRNLILELDGVKHTASEWARIMGIRPNILWDRKYEGWSDREALLGRVRKSYNIKNARLTISYNSIKLIGMIDWKSLIDSLPQGLSYSEAAARLGRDYQGVRAAIQRHGYKAIDGRKDSQINRKKFDPDKADWTKSNQWNATEQDCSRELVRRYRNRFGKPFVEARGRPKKVADVRKPQ